MANFIGTNKSDKITKASTTGADSIIGLADNDTLISQSGNGSLYGDVKDDVTLNFVSLSQTSTTLYDMKNTTSGSFGSIPSFGNDTLTALNGTNKMYGDAVNFSINVHGTDNLAAGVSAAVIVTNLKVSFGSDTLSGHGELYGDLDTFSVSVIAGSGGGTGSEATARIGILVGNPGGTNPFARGTDGLTVAFGNDVITTGSGNDLIYGDAKNYLVTLISGSNSVGATARARLDNCITTFGSDKISSGDGNDVVFGDLQNFIMTLTTGDNGSNNRAQDISNYSFGNDIIQVGNGNNFVYGDAQHVNWTFTIGSGLDGTSAAPQPLGFARWASTLTYGNDTISAGNGANWIYGDIQDWIINCSGGEGAHGENSIGSGSIFGAGTTPQSAATIVLGNDKITVGNGNNHLFGDADTFQVVALGPDNILTTSVVGHGLLQGSLSFGNDLMSAGNGSNVVYGDANQVIESLIHGDVSESGATSYMQRLFFDFIFGSDSISVGSGGNVVFGDVGSYLMQLQSADFVSGGVANGAESFDYDVGTIDRPLVYASKTVFGVDHINSGAGNDSLVGDVGTFTMDFHAGQHVDGSTGPADVLAGMGLYNDLAFNFFTNPDVTPITFGKDEINGGGGIDHIYGEGIELNISAIAGSIDTPYTGDPTFVNPNTGNTLSTSAAALNVRAGLGSGAPVTAGDDKLAGGSGNDVIFGDWDTLDITLQDGQGTGLSTIPELTDAYIDTLKMGDDILMGGSGNDVLYGDLGTLNFQHLDADGMLITDDITASNSNVHHFISGQNKYVYDGTLNNGDDTIFNFSVQSDTLVGQRGATFTDGGHNGSGDLVVVVHDAAGSTSSITLAGVHDAFSAILPDIQYVASPIV